MYETIYQRKYSTKAWSHPHGRKYWKALSPTYYLKTHVRTHTGENLYKCRHEIPKQFDGGLSSGDFHDTPKVYYRQPDYEACLQQYQPGYETIKREQQLGQAKD